MGKVRSGRFATLVRAFARVEPGEGAIAVLMLSCLFLLLCSYYLMKTAREGMILSQGGLGLSGQELKAYASGAMALLLVGAVPVYDAIADRVTRIRLINISYVAVLVTLLVFFALDKLGVPIGLPFFVWIGLVNVFLVAQFWSYANDIYTEQQGQRLFALIAIGGSLGGVFGPPLAALAPSHGLLLLAAVLVVPCVLLFNVIDRLHLRTPSAPASARRPIDGAGGFRLLLNDRYLGLVAALVFLAAVVKTIGEFVLSDVVAQHAQAVAPHDAGQRTELIEHFYSGFFFWVNLTSFAIQAFVVSRVIDRFGVRKALFLMPVVALGAYGAVAAVGGIAIVRIAKIAENSTDYSLENTLRQALFLPTGRAAKYKAKAAIDTFGVRTGDTVAALTIWGSLHFLGMHGRGLSVVNIGLVAVWLVIAVALVRRHRALARGEDQRCDVKYWLALLLVARAAHADPEPIAAGEHPRPSEPRPPAKLPDGADHTADDVDGQPVPGDESGRLDPQRRRRLGVPHPRPRGAVPGQDPDAGRAVADPRRALRRQQVSRRGLVQPHLLQSRPHDRHRADRVVPDRARRPRRRELLRQRPVWRARAR